MSETNEPAFPCDSFQDKGMTLRDYFAAKAMAGLMEYRQKFDQHTLAADAYCMADAMMEARKQKRDEVV